MSFRRRSAAPDSCAQSEASAGAAVAGGVTELAASCSTSRDAIRGRIAAADDEGQAQAIMDELHRRHLHPPAARAGARTEVYGIAQQKSANGWALGATPWWTSPVPASGGCRSLSGTQRVPRCMHTRPDDAAPRWSARSPPKAPSRYEFPIRRKAPPAKGAALDPFYQLWNF